ncbi:VanZ like family protein [Soonwooa buanensis]|uniref:VanZ like family protein n=1 Tax=Soonwooa buanensis TaxID=619805 RepID=A0A1T5ERB1_9FLAO|nr:VanZ family protein [Soonwooa buanensis]SKB86487.1 VanZ like family protein [Soonwooa buanensis]
MLKFLKTTYRILIIPYTILLLYFMFLGFGREVMSINIVRLTPLASTIQFVENSLFLKDILINIIGNFLMFLPFGFLAWIFPKFYDFKTLILSFLFVLIIVEALQYFTRLGVFDIDDIILNSIGMSLGFLLMNFLERIFAVKH